MKKFKININEVGIDEAGRGPWLGRVYAGAVIWKDNLDCNLINDSKKLSAKKRKIALEWIKENVEDWGVGYATEKEIDETNILEATKLAMVRAVNSLDTKPSNAVIDGWRWESMKDKLNMNITSEVKGDAKYYSIAASSIIAKEYHDNHIKELCEKNPTLQEKYDLLNNKGYGTRKHKEGIIKYGLCDFHRKSFKINKNY